MRIEGAHVLITGANRGLGRALVDAFLTAGAGRVYAAVRRPESVQLKDPRVQVVPLDVTVDVSVAGAAERCGDIDILVNNAAALTKARSLACEDLAGARLEMETNYWGVLRMCRAFTPHLARRGGGAIVNVLSIGALASVPSSGSYSASKAAAWSLTQSARAELRDQGTKVVAVFAGPIATEMARPEKAHGRCSPEQMAAAIVEALAGGEDNVFPDARSAAVGRTYAADPWALEVAFGKLLG